MPNMTPIPISPLQLKSHFFPIIRLQSMPGGKNDSPTVFDREFAFSQLPASPNEWQLELTIKLTNTEKTKPFIYQFEIQIIGIFELVAELPEDRKKPIVVVNGLSILYGAIREMVINLTSRSPYGALTLPTVSFTDALDLKAATENAPQTGAPTPAGK